MGSTPGLKSWLLNRSIYWISDNFRISTHLIRMLFVIFWWLNRKVFSSLVNSNHKHNISSKDEKASSDIDNSGVCPNWAWNQFRKLCLLHPLCTSWFSCRLERWNMEGFSKSTVFLGISWEALQDFQASIYLSKVCAHTVQKLWKFWASSAIRKRKHPGMFATEGALG